MPYYPRHHTYILTTCFFPSFFPSLDRGDVEAEEEGDASVPSMKRCSLFVTWRWCLRQRTTRIQIVRFGELMGICLPLSTCGQGGATNQP